MQPSSISLALVLDLLKTITGPMPGRGPIILNVYSISNELNKAQIKPTRIVLMKTQGQR